MQIAKACCGLAAAPRSFGLDFKVKGEKRGARGIVGEPCAWIWVAEQPSGRVGAVGFAGAPADFQVSGDGDDEP
eukprot:7858747-Alexandrium_andersonii.AAC.1